VEEGKWGRKRVKIVRVQTWALSKAFIQGGVGCERIGVVNNSIKILIPLSKRQI